MSGSRLSYGGLACGPPGMLSERSVARGCLLVGDVGRGITRRPSYPTSVSLVAVCEATSITEDAPMVGAFSNKFWARRDTSIRAFMT
jgi:hypothetical protein